RAGGWESKSKIVNRLHFPILKLYFILLPRPLSLPLGECTQLFVSFVIRHSGPGKQLKKASKRVVACFIGERENTINFVVAVLHIINETRSFRCSPYGQTNNL